jgi:hypothetical protein
MPSRWNNGRTSPGRGYEMYEAARTIATSVNRVGPLLTVDSYPTSKSPFDSNGHVIAQFLRSLQ